MNEPGEPGSPPILERDESSQPLGRRFAIPLAGTSILVTTTSGGIGLLTQLYMKESGAGPLLISLLTSLGAAGVLTGSLFWGVLSDRSRRTPLLFITTFALGVTVGILAVLPPPSVVLPAIFVRSFVRVGFAAVSMAIVSSASREHRRGRNLSYVSASRSFGFALGSAVAGYVLEWLGFRGAFLISAILPAAGIGFLLLLPPEPVVRPTRGGSALRLAASSGLANLYVGTMLRQMAIDGAFSLLYVYMAILLIPAGTMGLIASFNTGAQVGALILFGRLADRIGRRIVFLAGFALSATVPLLLAIASDVWGMLVAHLVVGLSFSALYVGSTAYIGDRVPRERQGAMLGLYESTRGLGGVFGPILAGALVPTIGYRGMFFVMSGIAGLGFLLTLLRRGRSLIPA